MQSETSWPKNTNSFSFSQLTSVVDGEDEEQNADEDEDEHRQVPNGAPAAGPEATPTSFGLGIGLIRTRFGASNRCRGVRPAGERRGGFAVSRKVAIKNAVTSYV